MKSIYSVYTKLFGSQTDNHLNWKNQFKETLRSA
jgi:hypothetical protein